MTVDLELLAVICLHLKFDHLILTLLFVVHNFRVSVVWTFEIGIMWFVTHQGCLSHHLAGCSWSHVCLVYVYISLYWYTILRQTILYLSVNWLMDSLGWYFLWIQWVPSIWTCRCRLCKDLCFYLPWVYAVQSLDPCDIMFNHLRICPTTFQTSVSF